MFKKFISKVQKGFTPIELLVMVGASALIAGAIIFAATAPSKQMAQMPINFNPAMVGQAVEPVAAVPAAKLSRTPSAMAKETMPEAEIAPIAEAHQTLTFDGKTADIYWDKYGVPYVYADTDFALFAGIGYANAKDRLWQAEVNRRGSRGILSEILGPDYLSTDIGIRSIMSYPENELQTLFNETSDDFKNRVNGFVSGLNKYIAEAKTDPTKLPLEFYALNGSQPPANWKATDVVAIGVFVMNQNFASLSDQHINAGLLGGLTAALGQNGLYVWDDIVPFDDPETPTTVPATQGKPPHHKKGMDHRIMDDKNIGDMKNIKDKVFSPNELESKLKKAGVRLKLGSFAIGVTGSKSANKKPMLLGAPQLGFDEAPGTLWEFQATGGESGFNVRSWAFGGGPLFAIMRTENFMSTVTDGMGANNDVFMESVQAFPDGSVKYLFNGQLKDYDVRMETFNIAGQAPVTQPMLRSPDHGPVIYMSPIDPATGQGYALTVKRATWHSEAKTLDTWLGPLALAKTFEEFRTKVKQIAGSANFMYAGSKNAGCKGDNGRCDNGKDDSVLAYFHTGKYPIRPEHLPGVPGRDWRLPLDGTGSAEWTGTFMSDVESVDPAQGYLVNWNNKPSDSDQIWGREYGFWQKAQRVGQMEKSLQKVLIEKRKVNLDDLKKIANDNILTRFPDQNLPYYLMPYLLQTLDANPSHPIHNNPSFTAAKEALENWGLFAFNKPTLTPAPSPLDPASPYLPRETWGTQKEGYTLWDKWTEKMVERVFGALTDPRIPNFLPEPYEGVAGDADYVKLETRYTNGTRLLHALDYEIEGSSGVPPNYADGLGLDYFAMAGVSGTPGSRVDNINNFMLDTLQTVLEENPEGTWEPARKTVPIKDNLSAIMSAKMGTQLPPTLGYIGVGERSSIYEAISFGNGNQKDIAGNSTHIGQSGFIQPVFGIDPATGQPGLIGAKPSPHFADQLGMSDNNEYKPDYLIKKNQWTVQQ